MGDKFEFFIDIFKAMKAIQQKMDDGFRLKIRWNESGLGYIATLRKDLRIAKHDETTDHTGGNSPTLIGCLLNLFYCFKEDKK